MSNKGGWCCHAREQVLGASLEAHVYASDNSALARDCRRDIKAANAQLLKLGRKVHCSRAHQPACAPALRHIVLDHIACLPSASTQFCLRKCKRIGA